MNPSKKPTLARLSAGRTTKTRLRPVALGLALASLLTVGPWPVAQAAGPVLPSGLTVVSGQATLSTQGSAMTVRNSRDAILNWQSFNIGAGQSVRFLQPDSASKVLNRVTGNDPSSIFGQLSSNGQVWLLNPHGVLFGQSARVDVASLVTSTLQLSDRDWLQGTPHFTSTGLAGSVVNRGELRTSLGGRVALLADTVRNEGLIDASSGQVVLAAGQSIDLVDTATPNLAVRVTAPAGEVLNLGRITAAGGVVDVHAAMVNQQGIIQADALGRGPAGEVRLTASQALTLGADSRTSADGDRGGRLSLQAGGGTQLVQGALSAVGRAGQGGQIDLLGRQVGLLDGAGVDASGSQGGGQVRVGGGLRGQDRTVNHAEAVFMAPQASIRADATTAGDGGRIILWSDHATRAYGSLSARGAGASGQGGFIETSGGWLDARPARISVGGAAGKAGQWLLDPNNLLITDGGPDTNITGSPNFSTTNDDAVISTATIASALNAGNNVTISTASAGTNSQAGDITMQSATLVVSPPAPVSLTLQADRNIYIRDTTVSTVQPLTINLTSAMGPNALVDGGSVLISNSSFHTAGGSFTVGGPNLQACGPTICTATTGYAIGHTPGLGEPNSGSTFKLGVDQGIGLDGVVIDAGLGAVTLLGATVGDMASTYSPSGVIAWDSQIHAQRINISGFADTSGQPLTLSRGVMIRRSSELLARQDLRITGNGQERGISIAEGAMLTVDPGGFAPQGTLVLDGTSRNPDTVAITLFSGATPVLKGTGQVDIQISAQSTAGTSFQIAGDGSHSGPSIDASAATSLSIAGQGVWANFLEADVAAPTSGTMTVTNSGLLGLVASHFTGTPSLARFEAGGGLRITDGSIIQFTGPGELVLAGGVGHPLAGEFYISHSTIATQGNISISGTLDRLDDFGGDAAVDLVSSTLTSSGSGATISITGQGGSGAVGVGMNGVTLSANRIEIDGRSQTGGSGVIARLSSDSGARNTLNSQDIQIQGFAGNPAGQAPTSAGIDLQSTDLVIGSGGRVDFTGDWVAFGGLFSDQASTATGGADRFSLTATRSILFNGSLDFRGGAGADVTFTSDSDSDLLGRVRLAGNIYTGGGDFTVTGGTGSAMGVVGWDFDGSGRGLPNVAVSEGATGINVFRPSTIDAGSGVVTLSGSAQTLAPAQFGTVGIYVGSDLTIRAREVQLSGSGGNAGTGIYSEIGDPNVPLGALNITASNITINASSTGLLPDGTRPDALHLERGGQWKLTNGGNLTVNATGDARLQNVQVDGGTGGSLSLQATGKLNLDNVHIDSAADQLSMGASELNIFNGSTLSANTVTLQASTGGVDLNTVQVEATDLFIDGTNTQGQGVSLSGSGRLQASELLRIRGRSGEAGSAGIQADGLWQLTAPQVWLMSDEAMRFTQAPVDPDTGNQAASPRINASERLFFSRLSGTGTMTVGGADAQLDTAELNLTLKDLGAGSKVVFGGLYQRDVTGDTWTALTPALEVSGQLNLPGRVRFYAPEVTFLSGARITAGASPDAIIVAGSAGYNADPDSGNTLRFDNQAGANVFNTPNGRWMIYAENPDSLVNLGGLVPQFEQYDTAFNRYDFTADGNVPGPLPAGNGVFYASSAATPADAPAQTTTTVFAQALAATASLPAAISTPGEGRVQDVLYAFNFDATDSGGSFRSVPVAEMSESQLLALMAARGNHKKKVFAEAIHQLEQDPTLADVPACPSIHEVGTGQCLITESLQREIQAARAEALKARATSKRKVKVAALPQIARKLALVIGVDQYQDKRIPQLENAVSDARAVANLLEQQLGYETVVLENASKQALVRSLNQLARDADADDSVVIYYAGHGELLASRRTGYWLAADANAAKPATWISNADIARLVAQVGARQVALISDSCYSGSLAAEERIVPKAGSRDAKALLQQRAVVVMSSGGNEPVSDEGKNGHSVFAWNLMESLKGLSDWQVGGSVFERVRDAVVKEFPQTPQYGAFRSGGHQTGADYVFEQRSFESTN